MKAIILIIAMLLFLTACEETVVEEAVNETNETKGPPPVQEITMEAKMYDFAPSTIHAYVNQTIILHVTSTDVDHGIAINEFGVREYLPAGEEKTITFIPDKPGEYEFYCSVFCGSGHSGMRGKLIVSE